MTKMTLRGFKKRSLLVNLKRGFMLRKFLLVLFCLMTASVAVADTDWHPVQDQWYPQQNGLYFCCDATTDLAEVLGCDANVGYVTIPSTVSYVVKETKRVEKGHGYEDVYREVSRLATVVGISSWAFSDCKNLKSVVIQNGVREIPESAFEWCTALASVTIPSSVTNICSWAFSGCESLKSITIPEGVSDVGYGAFMDCCALQSVSLSGATPIVFGEAVFAYCESITEATLSFDFCVENDEGWRVRRKTSISALFPDSYKAIQKVVIKGNGDYVPDNFFSGCRSLVSVALPSSISEIGYYAFASCESLLGLTLPSSVKTIGNYAFEYSGLQTISLPSQLENIGSFAFRETQIDTIRLPDSVTNIESYAFSYCQRLKNVVLPNRLQELSEDLFQNCSSLATLEIPNSVRLIGAGAFAGCSSLAVLEIPKSVSQIGDWAFAGCAFASFEFPPDVAIAGWGLFSGCESLTNVTGLSTAVVDVQSHSYMFSDCISLEFVDLPADMTDIGEEMFKNCRRLKTIDIPSGVTAIEDSAFSGCELLEDVSLPPHLEWIGNYAFYNCHKIDSIEIPQSVRYIGNGAFVGTGIKTLALPKDVQLGLSYDYMPIVNDDCKVVLNYESISALDGGGWPSVVRIGKNVTNIEPGAFRDASNLKEFDVDENNEVYSTFGGLLMSKNGQCLVACPPSKERVSIPDGVTSIGAYAFYGSSLASVSLPCGLERIGQGAFQYCHSLVSVEWPESVAEIPDYAFTGCWSLTEVTLPKSLTRIGRCAFYGSGLISVFVPDSVKEVDDSAFCCCQKLTSVSLPGGFERIGADAFVQTDGLFPMNGCLNVIVMRGSRPNEVSESAFYSQELQMYVPSCEQSWDALPKATWGGAINIDYHKYDDMPQLFSVTFDIGANGVCQSGSLVQIVANGGSAVAPVVEGKLGWRFAGWDTDFSEVSEDIIVHACYLPQVPADGEYTASVDDCEWKFRVANGIAEIIVNWSAVWPSRVQIPEMLGNCPVVSIGYQVFAWKANITEIIIPKSVVSMEPSAFQNCSSLVTIGVDVENPNYCSEDGLLYDKAKTTLVCGPAGLSEVIIPDGVTSIGADAFSFSDGLNSVTIPSSMTNIESGAFDYCAGLKLVYVAKGDAGRVKELYDWPSSVEFVEATFPAVKGDPEATVTGDAESGFVVKPSEGKRVVEVTIPQGVDAAKVTVEVSPKVASVKPNGATVKVVSGGADITEFLNMPAADGNGVVDLTKATVKEEIVKEAMDVVKGAKIVLDAANPSLMTANTRVGLFYQLREGATLGGMVDGDSTIGNGEPWSPEIKVKGGNSAFYSIGVGKGE